MKFALKSRVLLELGAELISSDAIALYELIKNAIDAGSSKIEVRIFTALGYSGYATLDRDLEELASKKVPPEFLADNADRYFPGWVEDEVKKALVTELTGKTVLDARAALTNFYRARTYIEIEDWGHGMTSDDVETNFLTIGTPNRAKQRMLSGSTAPILGEKGIGRLSSMRLGRVLDVTTATIKSIRWAHLHADWGQLIGKPDQELDDFQVSLTSEERKMPADRQGTLVRISDLQSDWSVTRLGAISSSELSKLQNPFDREGTRLDLRLSFNGSQLTTAIQEIDDSWLKKFHGFFDLTFDYVLKDGVRQPRIKGEVKYRIPDRDAIAEGEIDEKEITGQGLPAYSIFADPDQPLVQGGNLASSSRFAGVSSLGPFRAVGYWFNRQRMQLELDDAAKYGVFRDWVSQWGGGLLVYRDGYRVYPYANPDDDWLRLDKKALARRGFKLNRAQFVGHVEISSRGNPRLIDQTNRQGLVDSPEKRALVAGLQYVIWKELGSLVTKYEIKSSRHAVGSVQELDKSVKEKTKSARTSLRELASAAPDQSATIQSLRSYIDEVELAWSKAKSTIKQQQVQSDVYLHLAGVGMLLEFIIHDMTRATTQALGDLKGANEASPRMRSLFQQLKTLEKRLRVLDPVSTPGRQRKEIANIPSVIQTLVDAHDAQFARHAISVDWKGNKTLEARVVLGQMYQIFENLIANSVYWLGHERSVRAETKKRSAFNPTIFVSIDARARTIEFSDNGPGIDPEDADKVFVPFFSKKPDGRGIGLYIVKNLCEENNMNVSLLPLDDRDMHPGFRVTFAGN